MKTSNTLFGQKNTPIYCLYQNVIVLYCIVCYCIFLVFIAFAMSYIVLGDSLITGFWTNKLVLIFDILLNT